MKMRFIKCRNEAAFTPSKKCNIQNYPELLSRYTETISLQDSLVDMRMKVGEPLRKLDFRPVHRDRTIRRLSVRVAASGRSFLSIDRNHFTWAFSNSMYPAPFDSVVRLSSPKRKTGDSQGQFSNDLRQL